MNTATLIRPSATTMPTTDPDALVRSIGIPPRPSIVMELQEEIRQEDPDLRRVASLVSSDVALTASVLRVVNSPAYGASRRIETVDQAVSMIGLKQVATLVTGLVLRNVLRTDGPQLTRFWDVSAKRAYAMARLARGLRGVDIDLAQTFGLMCDVGIPLLMQRFPDYGTTLKAANDDQVRSFTEVEQDAHGTDHALIGSFMARSWGVSDSVCLAIRLHHDYNVFRDSQAAPVVTRLIAMGLVAEAAIQRFARMNASTEWNKGGDLALSTLMLSDGEFDDWIEELLEGFALGVA